MHVGGEKGYPLFFFSKTRAWTINVVFGLLVIVLCGGLYIWYSSVSNDPTPDSIVGFGYAFAGTTFLILAAVMYSLQRRARHRTIGQLHAALSWHVCFGVVGLALLFMHSFGNFNPRSGTFALYGLIALVISGFVGRLLDRVLPLLIAQEVNKALTATGEDRIEALSQKLQAIVRHNAEEVRGFATPKKDAVQNVPTDKPPSTRQRTTTSLVPRQSSSPKNLPFSITGHALHTSWDLAYISLEETPQELSRNSQQYRFVPDKKSALARPEALIPGAQEHISALKSMQQAMQRELFYRYVIRYWRVFHVSLALLTVGLVLWHIVYALQLLLPTFLHR
jgi:hypothetical protein